MPQKQRNCIPQLIFVVRCSGYFVKIFHENSVLIYRCRESSWHDGDRISQTYSCLSREWFNKYLRRFCTDWSYKMKNVINMISEKNLAWKGLSPAGGHAWTATCCQRIEADARWPPFADGISRRILLNEHVLISIKISLKFVLGAQGRIDNKSTFVYSDNGLAPNRRQAIIWTSNGLFHKCRSTTVYATP